MRISSLVLPGLLYCALLPPLVAAQQTADKEGKTDSPAQPSPTQPAPDPPSGAQPPVQPQPGIKSTDSQNTGTNRDGTSNDRLFYALPNFLTLENAGQVPPLATKEKFEVVARGSFDYILIPWYGFLAAISQAEDSEKGYGQGAAGYSKRFAAYFADGTIENFMTGAILPSLLRQDPRYFQLGQGSSTHRTGYAISRIFVTRTDSGHYQFNYSEIIGSALSAGISTYSYHPQADRTLANTLSVWGTQVAYDTLTQVVKEFWPDIRRKIAKSKKEGGS